MHSARASVFEDSRSPSWAASIAGETGTTFLRLLLLDLRDTGCLNIGVQTHRPRRQRSISRVGHGSRCAWPLATAARRPWIGLDLIAYERSPYQELSPDAPTTPRRTGVHGVEHGIERLRVSYLSLNPSAAPVKFYAGDLWRYATNVRERLSEQAGARSRRPGRGRAKVRERFVKRPTCACRADAR